MTRELVNEILNDILAKNAGNHNTLVTITCFNGLETTSSHINIQLEDTYVYVTDHRTYDKYITYESISAISAVRIEGE